MGAIKRRSLEQLYSGPQVLEVPLYSVFEASRYLQIPENTLRSWVSGRSYPLRSGSSRRSDAFLCGGGHADASRVGVSMPDACASCVRNA